MGPFLLPGVLGASAGLATRNACSIVGTRITDSQHMNHYSDNLIVCPARGPLGLSLLLCLLLPLGG